jgi:hypothetical protein
VVPVEIQFILEVKRFIRLLLPVHYHVLLMHLQRFLLLAAAVEAAITAAAAAGLVDLEQVLHQLLLKHIPLPLAMVARVLRARQGG